MSNSTVCSSSPRLPVTRARESVTRAAQMLEDGLAIVSIELVNRRHTRQEIGDLGNLGHALVYARQRIRLVVDDDQETKFVQFHHGLQSGRHGMLFVESCVPLLAMPWQPFPAKCHENVCGIGNDCNNYGGDYQQINGRV